jgi:hypothetical protein
VRRAARGGHLLRRLSRLSPFPDEGDGPAEAPAPAEGRWTSESDARMNERHHQTDPPIILDDPYLHHLREAAYDWAIENVDAAPPGARSAAIVFGRNVLALVDEVRRLRGGSALP